MWKWKRWRAYPEGLELLVTPRMRCAAAQEVASATRAFLMDGPSQSLSSRSIWLRSQKPLYAPSTEASDSLALVFSSAAAIPPAQSRARKTEQPMSRTDVRGEQIADLQ
jgi:hypothetical protein